MHVSVLGAGRVGLTTAVFLAHTKHRTVLFDGRNALDRDRLKDAGWRATRVGRASP